MTSDLQARAAYFSQALESVKAAESGQDYTIDSDVLASYQTAIGADAAAPTLSATSTPIAAAATSSGTGSAFSRGLILGQLSVIVLLILFIKFFVFSEAGPATQQPKKSVTAKMSSLIKQEDGAKGDEDDKVNQSILENTYYDMTEHPAETMDWFNVMVAQYIFQLRRDALYKDNIYHSLDSAFNNSALRDYTDTINLTEINIGNDYPIFSNCRIVETDGRLETKMDVDISDTITLGAETSFILNKPRLRAASLPVKIKISIVRFTGCLTLSLVDVTPGEAPDPGSMSDKELEEFIRTRIHNISADTGDGAKPDKTALMYSISPDYRLEFEIKSLIGSRAKLENMPRISSIIENILRKWFVETYIDPKFQTIDVPSMWPEDDDNTTDDDDKKTDDDEKADAKKTDAKKTTDDSAIAPTSSDSSSSDTPVTAASAAAAVAAAVTTADAEEESSAPAKDEKAQ